MPSSRGKVSAWKTASVTAKQSRRSPRRRSSTGGRRTALSTIRRDHIGSDETSHAGRASASALLVQIEDRVPVKGRRAVEAEGLGGVEADVPVEEGDVGPGVEAVAGALAVAGADARELDARLVLW